MQVCVAPLEPGGLLWVERASQGQRVGTRGRAEAHTPERVVGRAHAPRAVYGAAPQQRARVEEAEDDDGQLGGKLADKITLQPWLQHSIQRAELPRPCRGLLYRLHELAECRSLLGVGPGQKRLRGRVKFFFF